MLSIVPLSAEGIVDVEVAKNREESGDGSMLAEVVRATIVFCTTEVCGFVIVDVVLVAVVVKKAIGSTDTSTTMIDLALTLSTSRVEFKIAAEKDCDLSSAATSLAVKLGGTVSSQLI